MIRRHRSIHPRFSRRAALAGLGAGAVLAPFLPLLESEPRAQADPPPKRLLLVFSANGTIHANWRPSSGTETDFELGRIMVPLADHKADLVILDGMMVRARGDDAGPGDDHMKGMAMLWTGSKILEGSEFEGGDGSTAGWGGGISVDQHIANTLAADVPFSSIEASVQAGGADVWSRMCYSAPNSPIPPEDDPYALFDRIFGSFGQDQVELQRIRAERKSVIDVVRGELEGVQGRVSTADQRKIEAHLEAIRAIENRLDFDADCTAPTLDQGIDVNGNDTFPEVLRLQTELITMAFACDLTRVATLQWGRSVDGTRHTWLGLDRGHHDISHDGDDNETAIEQLTQINTWYAERFAELLASLKGVTEAGVPMLDNMLVAWGNELGRGNAHDHDPVPFLLAGKAGGWLQTGRWLQYDSEPHNRLLVSLCHAMGLADVESFGDLDQGSGPLSGLV